MRTKRSLLILLLAVVIAAGIVTAYVARARSSWHAFIRQYWEEMVPFTFDLSPSGRTLAFTAKGVGGRDLYLMDIETKHVKRLIQSPQFEWEVRFLNEDTLVISAVEDASNLTSAIHLYTLGLRDGARRQITGEIHVRDGTLTPLSADEGLFIRSRIEKRFNPIGIYFLPWCIMDVYGVVQGVYIANIQTGERRLVGGAYDTFVIHCAEGIVLKDRQRMIMQNVGSGNYIDLVTLNAPLGSPNLRRIHKKHLARNAHTPTVSPDERFLCFVRDDNSSHAIFRLDLNTLATTHLTVRNHPVSTLRATSRYLFFLEGPGGDVRLWGDRIILWRLTLDSKQLERVLSPEQFADPRPLSQL